jgi:GDPmannose 4,6-dehydratase
MTKTALITGITGQDGSYLAEFLLSMDYIVHGLVRRASTFNTARIDHIYQDPHEAGARLFLHYGDLSSMEQLTNLVYNVQPDEIYNLGAQSHVATSFEMPEYTGDVTALGATRLLESVRRSGIRTRMYQASSSEMFGNSQAPQNERTPFDPRSPYACAKAYAYWMTVDYRNGYNLFASNGILFNHESPRRGETFLTRKVTRAVAAIRAGKQDRLYLGNLEPSRDWGYAPEYVEAMWQLLQQDEPGDYVIGTGESHTVREFVQEAFSYVDLDWQSYVEIDQQYMRPSEVDMLKADASKAREELGWEARIKFHDLIPILMDAEMESVGIQPVGKGQQMLAASFSDWHHGSSAARSTVSGTG